MQLSQPLHRRLTNAKSFDLSALILAASPALANPEFTGQPAEEPKLCQEVDWSSVTFFFHLEGVVCPPLRERANDPRGTPDFPDPPRRDPEPDHLTITVLR